MKPRIGMTRSVSGTRGIWSTSHDWGFIPDVHTQGPRTRPKKRDVLGCHDFWNNGTLRLLEHINKQINKQYNTLTLFIFIIIVLSWLFFLISRLFEGGWGRNWHERMSWHREIPHSSFGGAAPTITGWARGGRWVFCGAWRVRGVEGLVFMLKILHLGMASMTLSPYETLEGPSIIGKFSQPVEMPIELPRLPEDSGKWQSAQLLTLTPVPCSFQLRTMGLLIASLVTRFILRK